MSSSDSDSSEYSVQELLSTKDYTGQTPSVVPDAATSIPSKYAVQKIDEICNFLNMFNEEQMISIDQINWFEQTLHDTDATFADGETIKHSQSLVFVLAGEITVTETGQVPRSGVQGDIFGHVSLLLHQTTTDNATTSLLYQQHIISSRAGTKCAFISHALIKEHVPLLPALLLLHQTQWLKSLNYGCRKFIASRVIQNTFLADNTLIAQNTVGKGLYIIVRGTCVVTQFDSESQETTTLTRLHPGHFFGEMSLMEDDDTTVANVISETNVATSFFSSQDAKQLLQQEPSFLAALNCEIARKSKLASRRQSSARRKAEIMYRSASMERMDEFTKSPQRKIRHSTMVRRSKSVMENNKKINIINGYTVKHTLGQGSYGKVKLVEDTITRVKFAMKIINRSILKRYSIGSSSNTNEKDALMREVTLMKQMRHPNIVNLIEVIDDPQHDFLYIISQYCDGGTVMSSSLGKHNALPLNVAHTYFRDLIRGVAFMHSQGIIHRDLKPENLLVDHTSGALKICDFGCSEMVGVKGDLNTIKGTPAFMAPELLLGLSLDFLPFATDLYSIGACLFMFVEGRPPYWERNEIEMVERLRRGVPPTFSKDVTIYPNLTNLLRGLLCKDPKKRSTMRSVILHDWTTQENSQPVYKTDALMEVALEDLSSTCRATLNMIDIENAISMSTISFHVVRKSTSWLKKARDRIHRRNTNQSLEGRKGGSLSTTADSQVERISGMSVVTNIKMTREKTGLLDIKERKEVHLPTLQIPTQKTTTKGKRRSWLCGCCQSQKIEILSLNLSPPGSPSPQLMSLVHVNGFSSPQKSILDGGSESENKEQKVLIQALSSEEDTSDDEDEFDILEGESALATIYDGPAKGTNMSKYQTLPSTNYTSEDILNKLKSLSDGGVQSSSQPVVTHGIYSSQGRLEYQEDRYSTLETTLIDDTDKKDYGTLRLYGIYDGHGGDAVSEMLSQRLLDFMVKHIFTTRDMTKMITADDHDMNNLRDPMIWTFQRMDQIILDYQMSTISSLSPPNGGKRNSLPGAKTSFDSFEKQHVLNQQKRTATALATTTTTTTLITKTLSRTNSSKSVEESCSPTSSSVSNISNVSSGSSQYQTKRPPPLMKDDSRQSNLLRRFQSDQSVLNARNNSDMCGFKHLAKAPGSTATVVVIENRTQHDGTTYLILHVAWLGDSKAVLSSKNGKVLELTNDHRATNPAEITRIGKVGGIISRGRINGSLQISRSFGDPASKEYFLTACFPIKYQKLVTSMTPKHRCAVSPTLVNNTTRSSNNRKSLLFEKDNQFENENKEQKHDQGTNNYTVLKTKDTVINIPGYYTQRIDQNDEFILIASDGVWDVIDPTESIKLARHFIMQNELTLTQIAEKLVEAATSRGTDDNTTLMIVPLHLEGLAEQ